MSGHKSSGAHKHLLNKREECRTDQCDWLTQSGHCSLKQMSARLIMGLRGQSMEVDKELDQLVGAIDSHLADDEVDGLLRSLAHRMEHLQDKHASSAEHTRESFESWSNQLSSISSAHWMPQLDKHNPDLVVRILDIAAQMQELARVHNASQLQRLQSSPEQDEKGKPSDFVTDNNERLVEDVVLNRISEGILDLLQHLKKSDDDNVSLLVEKLQRNVNTGLKPDNIPAIMVELVSLVKLDSGVEVDPFESYLLKLNNQLVYLRGLTEEIYQYRRQDDENRHNFRTEVATLLQELLDSHAVSDESHRQAILAQLGFIEQYGQQHDAREAQMQISYDVYQQRIAEMERDAAAMKTRMVADHLRASADGLTGLPNRVAYNEQIERDLQRWRRYGSTFSMAVVDLDLFKRINDTYGHQAGDKVLSQVGRMLRQYLRAADFVARYGGEEFVILFPSTTAAQAAGVAEKFRTRLATMPFCFDGQEVTVTTSVGVSEIRENDSRESLFGRADTALYKAKSAGRNRVVVG